MSHTLTIRRAQPVEAEQLTSLAHLAKASWGYPGAWIDAWRPDLTISADYVRDHHTAVAELDGRLVGVAALEQHPLYWSLEHVWIDPRVQGRGIGRVLVQQVLSFARAHGPGRIQVVSDPNAETFYQKLGAVRVGAQPAPMPGVPDRTLPILEFRGDAGPIAM